MAFETMLRQTVGVRAPSGRTKYGQTELGTTNYYSARIEPVNRIIYDLNQKERVAKYTIFFMPTVVVNPGHFIVYAGEQWEVISVEQVPGQDGTIHHKEVLV